MIKVTYATDFGSSESVIDLNELPTFVKKFTIFNIVPYNLIELDEFTIAFHNWMRKNDTPENAEKWFGYTDEDMLNVFKEETGW